MFSKRPKMFIDTTMLLVGMYCNQIVIHHIRLVFSILLQITGGRTLDLNFTDPGIAHVSIVETRNYPVHVIEVGYLISDWTKWTKSSI